MQRNNLASPLLRGHSSRDFVPENLKPIFIRAQELPPNKKTQLANIIKDRSDNRRIHPNFDRLIVIYNFVVEDSLFDDDLLLGFSEDQVLEYVNWYHACDFHALLCRESIKDLDLKIDTCTDGSLKNIYRTLKMLQMGKSATQIKRVLNSYSRPLIYYQHAGHLYNQYGLSYDFITYSRKDIVWLVTRVLKEPFNILGLCTAVLITYKITFINFGQVGMDQTGYALAAAWLTKVLWDFRDQLKGAESSTSLVVHWARGLVHFVWDGLHCKFSADKFKQLYSPFLQYLHLMVNLLLTVLRATLARDFIDNIATSIFSFDDSTPAIQVLFEPCIFIWPLASLIMNIIEAFIENQFDCRTCKAELEKSEQLEPAPFSNRLGLFTNRTPLVRENSQPLSPNLSRI